VQRVVVMAISRRRRRGRVAGGPGGQTPIVAVRFIASGVEVVRAAWEWGYSLSRTTGLPADGADTGNRLQPLGLASLFGEGTLVAISGHALATVASVGGAVMRNLGRPSFFPVPRA
jgi:hypothetical protein